MLILTVTNYGSAMQAAIPYLLYTPREMRKYFRKAHTVYLSREKPFAVTLKEEKSPVPFVRLLPVSAARSRCGGGGKH